MRSALYAVELEHENNLLRWGDQNHPDGTAPHFAQLAEMAKESCDRKHRAGEGTWLDILKEEYYEVLSETDPVKLRAELVQVAAVCVGWMEALDRRAARAEAA